MHGSVVHDFVVGVEIKCCSDKKKLFESLSEMGFFSMSPTHHVWPPGTRPGKSASSMACVNAVLSASMCLHLLPLWPR